MELRPMTPLCHLAKKHETDKGGRHYRYGGGDSDTCHEYTPIYWDLLANKQLDVKHVLEIGVNAGSSLRMWAEFFPNAEIVGFDCEPRTMFSTDRIVTFLADQGSPESLAVAMGHVGPDKPLFDLIIDDGSHETQHQIISMQTLLPFLADDGVYVVEDLQIDCKPEIVGQHVPSGYTWEAIPAPGGIGKAICGCGCGGPENLLVIRVAK